MSPQDFRQNPYQKKPGRQKKGIVAQICFIAFSLVVILVVFVIFASIFG